MRKSLLEKSALIKPLRSKAVEQRTLSSPLRMAGRRSLATGVESATESPNDLRV